MMIEKIGHIKNPLTVIAMFAAIAEISGTCILPFIEADNQSTYVWFLMLFPTFLVGVFFMTLNFNHRVLYAPSDFQNEDNFILSLKYATTQERNEKLEEEVLEAKVDTDSIPGEVVCTENEDDKINTSPPHEEVSFSNYKRRISVANQLIKESISHQISEAEELSILKLGKDLGMKFTPGIKMEINDNVGLVFDAVSILSNEIHAVEVKVFGSIEVSSERFKKFIYAASMLKKKLNNESKELILHVVAVITKSDVTSLFLEHNLKNYFKRHNVNVELHIFTLAELRLEFPSSARNP